MPTYAKTQLGLPLGDAFAAQLAALAWMILLTPVFGTVSDQLGRRPLIVAAALGYFLLPYPLFSWAHSEPSFGSALLMREGYPTAAPVAT